MPLPLPLAVAPARAGRMVADLVLLRLLLLLLEAIVLGLELGRPRDLFEELGQLLELEVRRRLHRVPELREPSLL